VVVIQAVMNYSREEKYIGQILAEKGAALIRSFEAGSRTGMMGMMGNEAHLQTLLEETASQGDISYIFITDDTGEILAHNQKQKIGSQFKDPFFEARIPRTDQPQWRVVRGEGGKDYFEVYKTFLPALNHHGGTPAKGRMGHNSMWCSPGWIKGLSQDRLLDPENRPIIFIGMDVSPFEAARREDLRNSGITIAVILFLGLTGLVSLFWAQNHARSRLLLQDTRAFASELVTSLPMGILAVNATSDIVYINDVAARLLNRDIRDTKDKKTTQLLPSSLLDLHETVKKGRPVLEKELIFETETNPAAPVAVTITEIVGEQGNFIGHVFILKDLSDIRALELEIQHKDKLAAVGNLAAGVAHEIRNPLSSIRGYATYFGSLFEAGSDNKKAAGIMAEEVDRVNRVISELLEFARPMELKLKAVEIYDLVDKALRLIKYEAQTANVSLFKSIEADLPKVPMDKDRFTQVLLNIFINGIQAMKDGGKLSVEVFARENKLLFHISDTGEGISADDQINIFNPYYTTKTKGTGLGLAIAFKIIESHGGSITIESAKGKGTLFEISIPFKSEELI
jgi:two-component system sensor histidine kinase HydH